MMPVCTCSSVHGLISHKCYLALCHCKVRCQRQGLRCLPGVKGCPTWDSSEHIQLRLWHLGRDGALHREMPGRHSHGYLEGCIANPDHTVAPYEVPMEVQVAAWSRGRKGSVRLLRSHMYINQSQRRQGEGLGTQHMLNFQIQSNDHG